MANPRAPPPTQRGGGRATAMVTRGRTFVDIVVGKPTPLVNIEIPWKESKISDDGQVWYQFTHEKIQKIAEPLKYVMVIKFLRKCTFVDDIRGYIKARWGLSEMPIIRAMGNPRQVVICINNEADFVTACSRRYVTSMVYRTDCSNEHRILEKIRNPLLLWYGFSFLDCPLIFFYQSTLKILVEGIGRFLKRDNAMICGSWPTGARVCVEMCLTKLRLNSFWIGPPGMFRAIIKKLCIKLCRPSIITVISRDIPMQRVGNLNQFRLERWRKTEPKVKRI
ncbi:Hypothetical predicted protein [Olea europaea subsp. europaea]|uniref:Uncharacterized protein n=1 Tax=Olea europaea subsp. europaea TaxID=158383 RepID=A0A8S0ULD7_OLEEU|nr:Hypothetical predicted protein [Olea europaea subsp. europaea]